jgi:hypothetical protein
MKLQELFSTDLEATPWRRQFLPPPEEYKIDGGSSWTLDSEISKNSRYRVTVAGRGPDNTTAEPAWLVNRIP